MKHYDWSRFPLLISVGVLLLIGGDAYVNKNEDRIAIALTAAGLVILGAWAAMELIAWHHRMHKDDNEGGDDSERADHDER